MLYFIKRVEELFLPMKQHILIVDDDREIFEVLAVLLEDEGYGALWAQNPEEFREKAFFHRPHLIILDIMLGEANGPEVYKKLLAQGLSQKIPVIFVSGLIPGDGPAPPLQPGRQYAMHSKPFVFEHLLRDIRTLILSQAA